MSGMKDAEIFFGLQKYTGIFLGIVSLISINQQLYQHNLLCVYFLWGMVISQDDKF